MYKMLWVILMMSCGATYISSLFPVYGKYYHLSNLEITLLFAVYAIVLLPTLLIVGARGNYWGLKKVLRISIWISIASTLLFIASQDVWMLYVARILEGIAYGAFTGSATAFLIKQTAQTKLGTALKLSGVAAIGGFGLGPAISGLVVQYVDADPLRMPYWVLLVMLVISLIILEILPKREDAQKPAKAKISLGIPDNIRTHFFSIIGLPAFLFFMIGGVILSLIPTFVKTVIHSTNLSVAGLLVFMLLTVAALVPLLPWAQNPVTRVRIGVICMAIGPWIIVYSGQSENIFLLWVGMLIQGAGAGLSFQAALRLAGQLPKPEERPRVISAFYLCAYAGFIIPPIGVGVLTTFYSLNFSLVILNSIAALLVIYVLVYSVKFKPYYTKVTSQ
ncbi:MFS transporter [Paenibacillus gansuensis]|uniref:MFS transporter n=1 Tax=Paenibacillus gansuensis TaxID=306542 RepID=A0ABW5PG84_9BACL